MATPTAPFVNRRFDVAIFVVDRTLLREFEWNKWNVWYVSAKWAQNAENL